MPFVLRTVQPVHVSRRKLTGPDGRPLVQDNELEAVFNSTLCCAIRQLSSLLENADDVFAGLTKEMSGIADRASALQQRLKRVQDRVDSHDPRLVPVPEGDLCAFAALPRDGHFVGGREAQRSLFAAATRPAALQRLYDAASRPALDEAALAQLDKLRRDGARSSTLFLCTPTLGRTRAHRLRKKVVDIDIETRKPASIVELRRWTSSEALGDITVHPDCTVRIMGDGLHADDDVDGDLTSDASQRLGESTLRSADPVDHQLPTTEEQVKAIADRFRPEVVKVDVTGKSFMRMTQCRRSLIHPCPGEEEARRRARPRRPRSRRRNTIAGTDQKEIEEALNGDRSSASNALTTVDDIILSSSSIINSNPKSSREANADFKKWAFNSLKRWGRSRLRAIASINSPASPTIISGELHAADPVDDINVYETVAGKRRGAGHIPISAGLSGPMSLAVKLREGTLGQRRLKLTDEPPHSSSGNWSASSESGRASVNSDSSHQPKSSTCSSVLPHRRRFINNSTSSSVTSEGTLTPEDMAAAPFLDDGETSSVYSCDTEGYYTSFHMDSGLKTLKEEEIGAGLSLPPTPMHSTSALSNCSSGRGSASQAQLTAESEYELFGKGSTSTTASSAGTVCTTLLADNSKGGDNCNGSDRSLCKGPAVPERKSSLNVPCLAQECPPCSTVVALIHNTNQGHSPCSISGDSPDSGHNTSSSPVESVSSPHDAETDALISPIPSIASEMEFSECSDFEGTDRIERIRVKTTINTSRIPSMCAITPPQSDDETNRNDNYHFSKNVATQHMDNNANKSSFESINNIRSITPTTTANITSIIHVDSNSGYATVHTFDNANNQNNINKKIRPPSPSGGTLFINTKADEDESNSSFPPPQPIIKEALMPFSSILSKFRKPSSSAKAASTINHQNDNETNATDSVTDESGEYVTITDVRNNNKLNSVPIHTPQRSAVSEPACESAISSSKPWESQEYVSLNELPISKSADLQSSTALSGSSAESSLERRRRQGARVILDSDGKVVYSSDSLRRRKAAQTTFIPGQCVKDLSSPSASPVANHRMPKAIIRPVQLQNNGLSQGSLMKSPTKLLSSAIIEPCNKLIPPHTVSCNELKAIAAQTPEKRATKNDSEPRLSPCENSSSQPANLRNKFIIRAEISSPTKDLSSNVVRSMSPRTNINSRGAYVHVQPPHKSNTRTNQKYLQTDFDGPEDSVIASLSKQQQQSDSEGASLPPTLKESSSNILQPIERTTTNFNQPLYQNVLVLEKDQRNQNFAHSPSPVALDQQKKQNKGVSFSNKHSDSPSTSEAIHAPLHSSTPTKYDCTFNSPLTESNTFSPIEREMPPSRIWSNNANASPSRKGKHSYENSSIQNSSQSPTERRPSLLLSSRTTMTAEELYAKIHKSKKQMNIKYEPEMVLSPSPSVGTQSPVGSERSISPGGSGDPKGVPRSRHSWSPNSSSYLDVTSNSNPQSGPTSPKPQVPKDHGFGQVTSTYDFKRLLLQHGTGSSSKSKLSAVERLKQAKQVATNVLTINSSKFRLGVSNSTHGTDASYRAPRNNLKPLTCKGAPLKSALLKPGPRSSWRFVGQKNDVRSTPIIEEQREDDFTQGALQIQNLSSSPMPPRNLGRVLAKNMSSLEAKKPLPASKSRPEAHLTPENNLPAVQNTDIQTSMVSQRSNIESSLASKSNQDPKHSKCYLKQAAALEEPDCSIPTALETAL